MNTNISAKERNLELNESDYLTIGQHKFNHYPKYFYVMYKKEVDKSTCKLVALFSVSYINQLECSYLHHSNKPILIYLYFWHHVELQTKGDLLIYIEYL